MKLAFKFMSGEMSELAYESLAIISDGYAKTMGFDSALI